MLDIFDASGCVAFDIWVRDVVGTLVRVMLSDWMLGPLMLDL